MEFDEREWPGQTRDRIVRLAAALGVSVSDVDRAVRAASGVGITTLDRLSDRSGYGMARR